MQTVLRNLHYLLTGDCMQNFLIVIKQSCTNTVFYFVYF
jgi:uncharacterized membrane protein